MASPKTNLIILNTSVVVLAQAHNPTILHPVFLKTQEIIPQDWEPIEQPICTPAFSIIKYSNGIVFTVESSKFQVRDENPSENISESEIPKLANKYIQTLLHARYTAVGVNIAGFIESSNPETTIIERFLKPGAWNSNSFKLQALGLRLVYPVSEGNLRLSCDSGTIQRPPENKEIRGISIDANYHTDLPQENTLEIAREIIELFPQRYDHFSKAVEILTKSKE